MNHAFLADLHLGHENVIKHDNRPYACIGEHDRDLTRMCACVGRKNATLWLLGDVAQRKRDLFPFMEECRKYWGKIILIRGNHDDKVAWRHRDLFDEAHESRYVRVDSDVKLYLSHYAHRVWRNSHHGSIHLHGHSHGHLPQLGRSMDVGAPCVGYRPIWLVEVVERMKDITLKVQQHPGGP